MVSTTAPGIISVPSSIHQVHPEKDKFIKILRLKAIWFCKMRGMLFYFTCICSQNSKRLGDTEPSKHCKLKKEWKKWTKNVKQWIPLVRIACKLMFYPFLDIMLLLFKNWFYFQKVLLLHNFVCLLQLFAHKGRAWTIAHKF